MNLAKRTGMSHKAGKFADRLLIRFSHREFYPIPWRYLQRLD